MRIAISPRRRARALAVGAAVLAVGASSLAAPAQAAPPERTAVIVQLTPGSDSSAEARRAAAAGGAVSHVYRDVFRGFAGSFTQQALEGLRRNPRVALIEADGVANVVASGTQTGATWGLDRIDVRTRGYDSTYSYPASGARVNAYIIDTGIRATHQEFGGRAQVGYDAFGGNTDDCNGHGTHVAGTVGGSTYGAAQDVSLVAVRVLGCDGSGTWSGVIAGMDWVARVHDTGKSSVANMSLGGSRNSSVDTAVKKLHEDGVTVVVAAGNSSANACNYSPARASEAITVGATDRTDTRASFSNYGSCLDIFAPGVGITSAWHTGDDATNAISGTSMASPHVAGAAAVVLEQAPGLAPTAVARELIDVATLNVVSKPGVKSPNRLLHVTAY